MSISAAARVKNNWYRFLFASLFSYVMALCAPGELVAAQAGSMVGATVCTNTSTVTLDTPVSDSVVTVPTVPISGTVTQASQVEVRIDNAFDNSIQLSMGQTTYSGSVQLSPGTHTIEVTAINICAGTNGMASSVVTFEAPPQTPSTGTSTPTNVGGSSGGVTVNSAAKTDQSGVDEKQNNGFLQQIVITPLGMIGQWLNINQNDYAHADEIHSMGLARAVTFGVGTYLLLIGLAPSLIAPIAGLPVFTSIIPGETPTLRVRWLRRAGRLFGLLLVLGTLLL